MLHRAASNAYSWWWASHIRTKQSKWLDQSLQDMEEKVQSMLKLIEEDGDSFVKRAEMYYKRRPELISNIEEAYKSFRALADRYDLLSKELQNANHTIATVVPDQVQFAIDEEEEEDSSSNNPKAATAPQNPVPRKIPTPPAQDIKALISTASHQLKDKKALKSQTSNKKVESSGLSREEAVKEIERLEKEILALQTMKEFVKSSYESGVAKYWELENQIMEMQQRACGLRDEFDVDTMIEDDDARTLMAQAALKSCQETLAILEAAQEKSAREAKEEQQRITAAWERLKSVSRKYLKRDDEDGGDDEDAKAAASGDYGGDVAHDVADGARKSSNEGIVNWGEMGSLTASELAEKVEQLVNKVIDLESAVLSQTVLVHTLRTETDDLNEQIRDLEEGHEAIVEDVHEVGNKVKEVEERLGKVEGLNKNLERESSTLQTTFAEARSDIDGLSGKLSSIKPDDEEEEELEEPSHLAHEGDASEEMEHEDSEDVREAADVSGSGLEGSESKKTEDERGIKTPATFSERKLKEKTEDARGIKKSATFSERKPKEKTEDERGIKKSATFLERKLKESAASRDSPKSHGDYEERELRIKVEEIDWNQILLSGMEDREKILLKEYTVMLRNYREVKKKLADMEKKEKDSRFDVTLQMRELKKGILKRDDEIQSLRQRIGIAQGDREDISSSPLCNEREMGLHENEEDVDTPASNDGDDDDDDDMRLVFTEKNEPISVVEEKFRYKIDAVLDENLDFWLRFSSAFHQVQKFRTEVEDLREIQAELSLWLQQSGSLKDELKRRFASLCSIQEEMTTALKEGVEEDEIKFSTHQAAKFQGEILNMKQENSKVREELRAGLDHVSMLQVEIENTLQNLGEEYGITSDQPDNLTRGRVPLRSFLFGTKPKRKHSIFSHMQPNRRYQILRAGMHLSKFHHS